MGGIFHLSEEARGRVLGFFPDIDGEAAPKVIDRVERALGDYPKVRQNVDEQPRPADHGKAYSEVSDSAVRLLRQIIGLGGWVHDAIEDRLSKVVGKPAALSGLEVELAGLLDALNSLRRDLEQDVGGRPKSVALPHLVGTLRAIFWDWQKAPSQSGPRRAFSKRPASLQVELSFLATCFELGGIEPKFPTAEKTASRWMEDSRLYLERYAREGVIAALYPEPDTAPAAAPRSSSIAADLKAVSDMLEGRAKRSAPRETRTRLKKKGVPVR